MASQIIRTSLYPTLLFVSGALFPIARIFYTYSSGSEGAYQPPKQIQRGEGQKQERNDHGNHDPSAYLECIVDLQLGYLSDLFVKVP